jgi:hypothetical protein
MNGAPSGLGPEISALLGGISGCTRIGALFGLDFPSVRANYRQRYRSVPFASWTLGR